MYFWAGMLLCVTFGVIAAGIFESWTAHLWWWLGFMIAAEVMCFALYFEVVRCWLIWMNLSGDITDLLSEVISGDERSPEPGRDQHHDL
jgi:hypothetical protein